MLLGSGSDVGIGPCCRGLTWVVSILMPGDWRVGTLCTKFRSTNEILDRCVERGPTRA